MADEVMKGPPTIKFGDGHIEIVESGAPALVADAMIEARDTGMGTMQIGFATLRATGSNPTRVDFLVCARLRISHATAIDLRNTLDGLLKPPVPKGEAH